MTHRQDLERHVGSLQEIRNILYSMKTLAYMETRKLERFIAAQQAVVENIEDVAEDFLAFHGDILPAADGHRVLCVLAGSERGFCGDFNHALVGELDRYLKSHPGDEVETIAIGRKLHPLLHDCPSPVHNIDGPGIVEEAGTVMNHLVTVLNARQNSHGLLSVFGISHSSDGRILRHRLLPPFQGLQQNGRADVHPPLLHLAPQDFFIELADHYLFAALNRMLYDSMMAENRNRVSHLEGAVRHLDDSSARLSRQCSTLRQEEIIEEIEVILLSTDSLANADGSTG